MYRCKDCSQRARRRLYRQLINANPGLKSIKKWVIVSSVVGQGEYLWFSSRYPYIIIYTPFLFDKQLIPHDFKGYDVVRSGFGLPPKRYFPHDKSLNADEKYSAENLINFVENHLELISWKLNRPRLTKEEALDALTGGFELHIKACKRLKSERYLK